MTFASALLFTALTLTADPSPSRSPGDQTDPRASSDLVIRRDVPYTQSSEPTSERQMLDIYAPASGKNHPVIVWIHGGGWQRGDKKGTAKQGPLFAKEGYVFVAINYRFIPHVSTKEMMGDVAKAIAWVHQHIAEYGGDPNAIVVMGHSAGAHLAALVCTDGRYLAAEHCPMTALNGCVPIDVSVYDIAKKIEFDGHPLEGIYATVFGNTAESQQELSPITYVGKTKDIPPFFVLYVASRPETKTQSEWLVARLNQAGIPSVAYGGEGKTHSSIGNDLGKPGDLPTAALSEFLHKQVPIQP